MQAGGSDKDDLDDVVDSTDELDEIDDGVESSSNENNNTITGTNNSANPGSSNKGSNNGSSLTANPNEDDKRKRRAIANSNERRRMQSINAGFQNLKALIPHSSGEKLSKACILQRSADYMQHLNKEKEKLASNLQIALKILETNGLSTQFQSQVNLDSYKLASSAITTTNNNAKLNKQLIINISSATEPQPIQSQPINEQAQTHEQVSPKVTSPKNQQLHHADYTTALITSKRRSINSICSSPPQQGQLQSSINSIQQTPSSTTSSIVSNSTTTSNQKLSAQTTIDSSITASNPNVVKSENACSLTSILPVVATQQNTMPNDNICCLIALPNLDHPKVNSPIIDANEILTSAHNQNDEKFLNSSSTNKKRDTSEHVSSLVSCSNNSSSITANVTTSNRQLTDTTNQIKKPYTISTTPSLITNITSSQPSSNPNGGNLLILPDSSTIQLITTPTSGQHQSAIPNSPEFIKSSRSSCNKTSRKIADIDLANTPQFIDTASIPTTTKLPTNILIKLVEILRSNNTTATTVFPNSAIQMIPPTMSAEQLKNAQSNSQIAVTTSQGQIVLIESPSSTKNIKTNTAASDADDENDDFENEDIDLDLDSYHSDTNQPPPNKRSILTIQTSTSGEICLVDEDMSHRSAINKSTKIRHINHHHLLNSPGNYGHQQQKSSRSNSIDQLLAAAAVTSAQSPTESSANASSNECQSNLSRKNLNTIVEAIKHVEGFVNPYTTAVADQNSADLTTTSTKTCQVSSSGDDNPNLSSLSSTSSNNPLKQPQQITAEQQAHKPPKKRKYTTEDSIQNTTNSDLTEQKQSSIQNHPPKIGILSLNQQNQQQQTPLQQPFQATTPAMCYIDIAQLNELIKIAASSDLEKLVQPYLLTAASATPGQPASGTPMTMNFGSIVEASSNATHNLSNIVVVSSSDDPSAAVVPLAAASNPLNNESKGSGSGPATAADEKKINVLVTS